MVKVQRSIIEVEVYSIRICMNLRMDKTNYRNSIFESNSGTETRSDPNQNRVQPDPKTGSDRIRPDPTRIKTRSNPIQKPDPTRIKTGSDPNQNRIQPDPKTGSDRIRPESIPDPKTRSKNGPDPIQNQIRPEPKPNPIRTETGSDPNQSRIRVILKTRI